MNKLISWPFPDGPDIEFNLFQRSVALLDPLKTFENL